MRKEYTDDGKEYTDDGKEHTDDNFVYGLVREKPSHTEKRFRFFLDWDPTVLKKGGLFEICCKRCEGCKDRVSEDEYLGRFQMIFEIGMSHYPEEIGFLFHRAMSSTPPFQMACKLFGKEVITKMFDKMILKSTMGRCDAIRTLVFAAAAISLDGLYLLIRLDPIALISADTSR